MQSTSRCLNFIGDSFLKKIVDSLIYLPNAHKWGVMANVLWQIGWLFFNSTQKNGGVQDPDNPGERNSNTPSHGILDSGLFRKLLDRILGES